MSDAVWIAGACVYVESGMISRFLWIGRQGVQNPEKRKVDRKAIAPLKGRAFKIKISSGGRLRVKKPVCGPARAESPTSPEPRATPWVPCPHSLRPVRAKVKSTVCPYFCPYRA